MEGRGAFEEIFRVERGGRRLGENLVQRAADKTGRVTRIMNIPADAEEGGAQPALIQQRQGDPELVRGAAVEGNGDRGAAALRPFQNLGMADGHVRGLRQPQHRQRKQHDPPQP